MPQRLPAADLNRGHAPTLLCSIRSARISDFVGSLSVASAIPFLIGLVRKNFLARNIGTDAVRVMRAIKRALDPKGILNPGKIIDLESPAAPPRSKDGPAPPREIARRKVEEPGETGTEMLLTE